MLKIGYLLDSGSPILERNKGMEVLNKIEYVPFIIISPDQKEYSKDEVTIDKQGLSDLFDKFPNQPLKTSLTPRIILEEKITKMLEKYDYVVGFPIAKALSNQFDSFNTIAQSDKFKGRFFVLGQKNAASSAIDEISMLDKLVNNEEQLNEAKLNEAYEQVSKNITQKILLYVSDLTRITLSGRISKTKSLVGKALKLKVSFSLDNEKVIPIDKGRSIFHLVDKTVKEAKEKLKSKIKDSVVEAVFFVSKIEIDMKNKVIQILEDVVDKVTVEEFPPMYLVHLGLETIAINLIVKKKSS